MLSTEEHAFYTYSTLTNACTMYLNLQDGPKMALRTVGTSVSILGQVKPSGVPSVRM